MLNTLTIDSHDGFGGVLAQQRDDMTRISAIHLHGGSNQIQRPMSLSWVIGIRHHIVGVDPILIAAVHKPRAILDDPLINRLGVVIEEPLDDQIMVGGGVQGERTVEHHQTGRAILHELRHMYRGDLHFGFAWT